MGIVLRQSVLNTAITYIGFGLGALNNVFLYTRVMSETSFGLVGVLLSTATLLMPVMSFGIPNTMVKYFAGFRQREDLQGFLTLVLLLPLCIILPLAGFSYMANEAIAAFLARKNAIVADYVWHIFWIGLFMAYFEIFFAWSKVCLKTIPGTILKEIFVRAGVTVLLVLLFAGYITEAVFLSWLVALFAVRTLLMAVLALRLQRLTLRFSLPKGTRGILQYSSLIIIGGSISVVLLEIDRFMINQYIRIENVAYYTVAVFIATVIIVPFRSLNQIAYPMTASLMHSGDQKGLRDLYKRSSLSLLTIASLIFLGILLNLEDFYRLLPENYRGGFQVVLLLGLARVFDSFLGINTAILYNSKYYGTLLLMGVLLALLTIALNAWWIPAFGLNGAALATLVSVSLYNLAKMLFVQWKFGLTPWTPNTYRVLALVLAVYLLFSWVELPFHPVVNILVKSLLIALCYLGVVLRFNLSEDLTQLLRRRLKE